MAIRFSAAELSVLARLFTILSSNAKTEQIPSDLMGYFSTRLGKVSSKKQSKAATLITRYQHTLFTSAKLEKGLNTEECAMLRQVIDAQTMPCSIGAAGVKSMRVNDALWNAVKQRYGAMGVSIALLVERLFYAVLKLPDQQLPDFSKLTGIKLSNESFDKWKSMADDVVESYLTSKQKSDTGKSKRTPFEMIQRYVKEIETRLPWNAPYLTSDNCVQHLGYLFCALCMYASLYELVHKEPFELSEESNEAFNAFQEFYHEKYPDDTIDIRQISNGEFVDELIRYKELYGEFYEPSPRHLYPQI